MKIKEGASLSGLSLVMRPALMAAERIWKDNGQELVITSGTDGEHSAGSYHYYGLALDMRTHYFEPDIKDLVYQRLSAVLEPLGYHVIMEPSHIHVHFPLSLSKELKNGKSINCAII